MSTFATLADLKVYLGITGTDSDSLLTTMLEAATKSMQNLIGRSIFSATYTEKFQSRKHDITEVQLKEFPITSITSITDGDGNMLDESDYELYEEEGCIVFSDYYTDGLSLTAYKELTVVYVAGYATVPADIEMACMDYAKQMYLDRDENPSLSGERLGDYSYTKLAAKAGQVQSTAFLSAIMAYKRLDNLYVS
jgi:uncharacterized phiE125 gp8 family phage protein